MRVFENKVNNLLHLSWAIIKEKKNILCYLCILWSLKYIYLKTT